MLASKETHWIDSLDCELGWLIGWLREQYWIYVYYHMEIDDKSKFNAWNIRPKLALGQPEMEWGDAMGSGLSTHVHPKADSMLMYGKTAKYLKVFSLSFHK